MGEKEREREDLFSLLNGEWGGMEEKREDIICGEAGEDGGGVAVR